MFTKTNSHSMQQFGDPHSKLILSALKGHRWLLEQYSGKTENCFLQKKNTYIREELKYHINIQKNLILCLKFHHPEIITNNILVNIQMHSFMQKSSLTTKNLHVYLVPFLFFCKMPLLFCFVLFGLALSEMALDKHLHIYFQ